MEMNSEEVILTHEEYRTLMTVSASYEEALITLAEELAPFSLETSMMIKRLITKCTLLRMPQEGNA